ncbi:histidine kinase [Tupanvirus deep ocean]|uniref:Histidine kinase n=2 Tax=Tupanvirus TaxID=2094720 RepID=A0AC62A8J9_9VIRU|nr:histidine kinase [Tupanvirus deep ocean]QKU34100.1 histidine kinase [Tupanvirus deep ocean]
MTRNPFLGKKYNTFTLVRKYIIVFMILFILILFQIGITLGVYYYIKVSDDQKLETKMKQTNDNIMSFIDLKINETIFIIRRNAAFFRIHGIYVSANNYTDFLQNSKSPSIDNIDAYLFFPKIANQDLQNFQNFCKEHIYPDCLIKQLKSINGSNIIFEEVSGRDYYYPLIYADPKLPNNTERLLIGFDFNSYNTTKLIIDISKNNTNISATSRINLLRPRNNNPYSYDILLNRLSFVDPNTPDVNKIMGISSALVRLGDIVINSIDNIDIAVTENDLDIFVFDITNDGYVNNYKNNVSLLYKNNMEAYKDVWYPSDMDKYDNTFVRTYDLGMRNWSIYFKYSKNYIERNRTDLIIIIPCVMAGIFLLIDIIIVILYKLFESLKQKNKLEKNKATVATQMLGYVNHEIRNPLNVIKGLVEFTLHNMNKLDENKLDRICMDKMFYDTIVSDLSTVSGSCNMLEHIVTDILDINKLDSGKLELDNKWVKIRSFVNDISKTISQKIDEKQTIKLDVVYEHDLVLYFDIYRMKQILLNFLTNAVKYTLKGSITIKIEELNGNYRFSVTDTGRGIKDEAKFRIFQPFNQTNPEDASRYGGIGLGLYLCKMLTERMGGKIGFESTYGVGSTFWVDFPVKIIKPLPDKIELNDIKVVVDV